MTALDILREGRPSGSVRTFLGYGYADHLPKVECVDGFTLSVQASSLHYCTPRDDYGPWTAVEVGFPSETPEPWDEWRKYVEDEKRPTDTVYAWVPLELVERTIAAHGGAR